MNILIDFDKNNLSKLKVKMEKFCIFYVQCNEKLIKEINGFSGVFFRKYYNEENLLMLL